MVKKLAAKGSPKAHSRGESKNLRVTPLGDRVLVKPLSEGAGEKSEHGIIIPETVDKEKPEQGTVVAVGEGRYEDGKLIPMKVKAGDKILFSKYGFDDVKINDEEYYILKEENILAVIK